MANQQTIDQRLTDAEFADDYKTLRDESDTFARIAAQELSEGHIAVAQAWAARYVAAENAISRVVARHDGALCAVLADKPVAELAAIQFDFQRPLVSGDDLARHRAPAGIVIAGRTTATAPGVFGAEQRPVRVARRLADGAVAFVALATPMEGAGYVAWVEENYSLHHVHADEFEAARVVIESAYGKAVA